MSRVNLLPSEIKKGQQVRRRSVLVAIIGAAVIGVIIVLSLLQSMRLAQVNDDIEAQNRTNQALQAEINDLQRYEDLQTEAQQQQTLLESAYANEVAYSGVLVDVSKVIPSDTYLASFSSSVDTAAAPSADTTTTFVGTMTFTGSTATGRRVMANAASTVKRVLLELGGKSATIMLDDADLPSTLASIGQVCTHGGQGCALTTRLLLTPSS